MTLTTERDLGSVKMNQRAKYLGQRLFRSEVTFLTDRHTHTHTPATDCFTWTTKWSTELVHW